MSVAVTAPAGAETLDPDPPEPLPDGRLLTTRHFKTRAQIPKPLRLEGVSVTWQRIGGQEGRVEVPAQEIPVKSMLLGAQNPQFRSFQALPEEPEKAEEAEAIEAFWARHGPLNHLLLNWPLIIGLILLLVALLALLLGMLVRRWLDRRDRQEIPWVDPRPAHIIALEALEMLRARELIAQGEMKDFYVRISEIIRAYLERRFGFTALEMTSDEIRGQMQCLELSAEAHQGMDDFLMETDLVKFADFAPSESEADTVMKQARGLINSTRVQEEEER